MPRQKTYKPKKMTLAQIKINFNDIVMRELGLDADDDGHVYDIETDSAITIKDKFIKHPEDEYPVIGYNEIDMNLIENSRMTEMLFSNWVRRRAAKKGLEITSMYHTSINGSIKGIFVVTYVGPDGMTNESKSDVFVNESVRIFNLICKLRHTCHLYDLTPFDIEIEKPTKR